MPKEIPLYPIEACAVAAMPHIALGVVAIQLDYLSPSEREKVQPGLMHCLSLSEARRLAQKILAECDVLESHISALPAPTGSSHN